jgi:hypothetical protein
MSKYLLPTFGAVGVVTLKEPFTGLVAPGLQYKVTALRMLQDILAEGDDPFEKHYAAYEIPEEKFLEDVRDGVCIISLTSPLGETINVPNSYLANLPVGTGIPYATMMVGVNLGALPTDLNLGYFMTKVKELANDLLGVSNADVKALKASSITYMSVEDSAAIETARKVVMETVVTTEAKLYQSEQARLALQTRNGDLEAYILANHPPE